MKKIVCVTMVMLLLLNGCTPPESTESFTQGIYEFTFAVEQISGEPTDEWEFAYTYKGETITTGHQILFSLEIFAFHSIQVEIIEKNAPANSYSAKFPVAICAGGSGKAEVTVTTVDGTFKIACRVTQIGKQ